MRTLLICHADSDLDREGLARWLASFSELVGLVVIEERGQMRARLRHELKRVGWLRLVDVAAFRLFQWIFLANADAVLERLDVQRLLDNYAPLDQGLSKLTVATPNSAEAREFIASLAPDLVIARCKFILRESVFNIPRCGTFVMHPGICPEYRNSHGCFWALSRDDLDRVGMTLLRIDRGVDTGPVFGYFSYAYDEVADSHTTIQRRVVSENLPAIELLSSAVYRGEVEPIDTSGRMSRAWGQPWLSSYLRWKRHARARRAESLKGPA